MALAQAGLADQFVAVHLGEAASGVRARPESLPVERSECKFIHARASRRAGRTPVYESGTVGMSLHGGAFAVHTVRRGG